MNPLELAEQLGKAIIESAAYRIFKDCKTAMENCDEAIELMINFQNNQQDLTENQQAGMMITQERIEELRQQQQIMLENPAISTYLAARKDVDALLASVNDTIARITGMETGGGCSSGGCGGCC